MLDPRLPLAAITDEFSPQLSHAIAVMREIGMTAAELRTIDGKNILDLTPDELQRAKDSLDEANLCVVCIASPLLKCVLPNAPPLDMRFEPDAFASRHTFDDQPRLSEHALSIAKFFGARIVRVFSYWRTIDPEACLEPVMEALLRLANLAERENLMIGLENEHACNLATAAETMRVLHFVPHPNLGVVWDPANALIAGEDPFPSGYERLAKERIVHVHAKDCRMEQSKPVWGPLGTRSVRWKEQIGALLADGYRGYLSLETHWSGPHGNKLEASRICGWNLRGLSAQ